MSKETIRVPDVGSSDPVDLIEISVKKGDVIAVEDTIVVLESEKASLEVPAPMAGKVLNVLVKTGDKVKEGDPLLEVEVSGESAGTAASGEDDEAESSQAEDSEKESSEAHASETKGSETKDSEAESEDSSAQDGAAAKENGGGASQPSGGGVQAVTVPDLGDISEAEIIEVSVAEGDRVEAEQTIIVLESDKASLEVPAPAAGVVKALKVKTGDKVSAGAPLMDLETEGGGARQSASEAGDDSGGGDDGDSDAGASAPKDASDDGSGKAAASPSNAPHEADKTSEQSEVSSEQSRSRARQQGRPSESVHAGPAVRKLARETGVDLAQVTPTGPKDRVLKEDVHAYLKQRMEQPASGGVATDLPEIDFSEFGSVQREELGNLRKVAARNLHRAWITIPHVTQFDEADITELEAFRKSQNCRLEKDGIKLTMLAFLVKACATALREFPHFNSSLKVSGEALIVKDYVHIGIAVDTPNGLVVPVLRDADRKGLKQIAEEAGELAAKARDRKLKPGDMKGASFSISSLGGIGGTAFTPIVNWPEVAILGVSRSVTRPVWDGQSFQPRLMLPLSLSYDHRVIDGAAAARFTTYLSELLGDMRQALL